VLESPAPDPDELDTTMVKGYVLIRLLPGLESDALQQIRAIPGVQDIILVFGGWDAVVEAEGRSLNALARLVMRQIRGVQATETLISAEL
jgi:DNA-binding Lrp family transcriptional regulator